MDEVHWTKLPTDSGRHSSYHRRYNIFVGFNSIRLQIYIAPYVDNKSEVQVGLTTARFHQISSLFFNWFREYYVCLLHNINSKLL